MTWDEIRALFPHEWVLIEALDSYTDDEHGKRIIPHMSLIKACGTDSHDVWEAYKQANDADPAREYYFLHTDQETIDIGIIDAFGRVLG